MTPDHRQRIEKCTGARVGTVAALAGGCVAEAWRIRLSDGRSVVAKTARGAGNLDVEGYMLGYLRQRSALPVPAVLLAEHDLLVMEYVESSGTLGAAAERHAADLLVALHSVTGPAYGHERDTLIGPLPQPNPWTRSWRQFFRDQRLLAMGRCARDSGRLPHATYRALERLCDRLDRYIPEPEAPSLIHGDMWGGNVLAKGDRIAAFVDPAIYHAHAEIELAFSTLFATFGDTFFRRYGEQRPIPPGFFEERRHIYNLYPLLVHTHLFGGSYAESVTRIVTRFA